MLSQISRITAITAIASIVLLSGCVAVVAVPRVPAKQARTSRFERGAVSGVAQRMGFFYAVNADCTSSGLTRLNIAKPPAHGSVSFVVIEDYPTFPRSNAEYYACNKRRTPGVSVVYRSTDDFTGADDFSVEGVGPKGRFLRVEYFVTVLPHGGGD